MNCIMPVISNNKMVMVDPKFDYEYYLNICLTC
jgi:hypothetical protein